MKKLISLIAIPVIGCLGWSENPTHKYQLAIDLTTLTPNQASVIAKAADDWSTATNGFVFFYTNENFQPLWSNDVAPIVNVRGESDQQLNGDADGPVGICYWHGESSDIVVVNDRDDDYLRRVATHELGHSIGLVHTGPGTIMYYNLSGGASQITCADVTQVCNVWNGDESDPNKTCAPNSMEGCASVN